jgi:hypothetical protein
MPTIRIDSRWQLRLPPEVQQRLDRQLVLRVLAGWAFLGLLALVWA